MRISDWSSDVCSSDLRRGVGDDAVLGRLVLVDHETAVHRVVIARGYHRVVGIEGGEAHAVGVVGQLLELVNHHLELFAEGERVSSAEQQPLPAPDDRETGWYAFRDHQVRPWHLPDKQPCTAVALAEG